jgi:hypothetical protein
MSVEVEQKLRALLPEALHEPVPELAALLAAAASAQLTQDALRQELGLRAATLRPLLQALAGQRLEFGNAEIIFDPVGHGDTPTVAVPAQPLAASDHISVGDIAAVGSAIAIGAGASALVVSLTVYGARLDMGTPQPVQLVPRPPARPPLLDRAELLERLNKQLAPRQVFWLAGAWGGGATTLAAAAANVPSAEAFPDGVAYIDGAGLPQEREDVVQAIYNRFFRDQRDLTLKPIAATGAQEQADWLAAQLGELQALFVLDRLPLEVRELASLADQLQACGAVLIAPDGTPPRNSTQLALGPLPPPDALALLEQFVDITEHREHIEQLCERLSCLPLGLVLVGGLLAEGGSLQALLERSATLPAERQPLTHAVTLVLEALGPDERAVVGVLVYSACTRAPFDLLVAVSERQARQVGDALERLVALGLVVDVGRDTFDLASAGLRRVLVRLLPENGERRRGVAFWAGAVALPAADAAWLHEQQPNLQAAAETALEQGLYGEATTLLRAVEPTLVAQGYWASWGTLIGQAFTLAEASGDAALRAWALHAEGTRAGLLGNLHLAQQSLSAAEQLRVQLGDDVGVALTRHNYGVLGLVPPSIPTGEAPLEPLVDVLIRRRSPFANWSFWLIGLLGVVVGLALVFINFGGIDAANVPPTPDAGGVVAVPSATPTPDPTEPPPATATGTPPVRATATLLATATIAPTTALAVASLEPLVATATAAPTDAPTDPPTPVPTDVPTAQPTATATPTPTATLTPTALPTATATPTTRPSATATTVPTSTETATSTVTITATLPAEPVEEPIEEPVEAPGDPFITLTPTLPPTLAPTITATFTPTVTATFTPTITAPLTPTATFIVVPPP